MASKHPSEPATPRDRGIDRSNDTRSPSLPRGFDPEERTTVPALRRPAKYLKVLVAGVRIAIKATDDGE